MLKALLFDLDETLLQLRLKRFLYNYFFDQIQLISQICQKPSPFVAARFIGIMKALNSDRNDSLSNEEFYYREIERCFCLPMRDPLIADCFHFYQEKLAPHRLRRGVRPQAMPYGAELIRFAQQQGLKLILATNPITPLRITLLRLSWTGLAPEIFSYISSLENSHRCKPHHSYYQKILDSCELYADECIMIGNDPAIDIVQRDSLSARLAQGGRLTKESALYLKTFLLDSAKTKRYPEQAASYGENRASWVGNFAGAQKLISELLSAF